MDPWQAHNKLQPGVYAVSGVGQSNGKNANQLAQQILDTDQRIFQKLLVMKEIETRLPAPFQTPDLQNEIQAIKQRYQQRQQQMEQLEGVKNVERGTTPMFEWLFKKFSGGVSGIGFAVSGTVAAITAATLAIAGGSYAYIRTHYQQAKSDERKLNDLLETYKSSAGDKAKDLEPMIEQAINGDNGGGYFTGISIAAKWLAVAALGYGGIRLAQNFVK